MARSDHSEREGHVDPKQDQDQQDQAGGSELGLDLQSLFLLDESNRLAACGDWCAGSRVEDAYLSALKLGEHLKTIWRREA